MHEATHKSVILFLRTMYVQLKDNFIYFYESLGVNKVTFEETDYLKLYERAPRVHFIPI